MIHGVTAQLIQLHRRLGDARLMRWLWGYSIGQSLDALTDLAQKFPVTTTAATKKLASGLIEKNVGILTWLDPEYPACLRAMDSNPPPFLYLLGDPGRLTKRSMAIIGTRRPTAHGKTAVENAVKPAVQSDWVIVSGNAPGIDSNAHEAALNEPDGQTIVFPPTPIDQYKSRFRVPPGGDYRLTVASPFLPGSEIKPWMFLRRNSLVAAHCSAAIVAETGMTGGTHDTIKKLTAMHKPIVATELPEDSRYAAAHGMFKGGLVRLVPLIDAPATTMTELLNTAEQTDRHPPVKTAVLPDFFGEELFS